MSKEGDYREHCNFDLGDMAPETWVKLPKPGNGRKSILSEPVSLDEYNKLQAGEETSWFQIIREHPMIGTRTIEMMLASGSLQPRVVYEPTTGEIQDIRLQKIQPNGGLEVDAENPFGEGRRPDPPLPLYGYRQPKQPEPPEAA